jgi:hypothetical protein
MTLLLAGIADAGGGNGPAGFSSNNTGKLPGSLQGVDYGPQ